MGVPGLPGHRGQQGGDVSAVRMVRQLAVLAGLLSRSSTRTKLHPLGGAGSPSLVTRKGNTVVTDPHGSNLEVSPARLDPHHFANGDAAIFGYGDEGIPVVIENASPDAEGHLMISGYFGDPRPARASIGSLLHRRGCAPCEAFNAGWKDQQAEQADAHRAEFIVAARRLADHLYDHALTPVSRSGLSCGHGDQYRLSEDALVPAWLHDALAGAVLTAPEGGWPNWGRTHHCVDWPALIAAHPETLVPDFMTLEYNHGATWKSIAAAFQIARSVDPCAHMDANFWVACDGRITVEAGGIFTNREVSEAVARKIDQILVAGGRNATYLHDDERERPCAPARCGWLVLG
jgi:hypothetical protein